MRMDASKAIGTAASVALALAAIGLAACGESRPATAATASQTTAERPPRPAVSGVECPPQIRIADRPKCKLIRKRVALVPCPDTHIGGHLRVAGLPCREAYELMGPLGSAGVSAFGDYSRSRLVVYRPAVATYKQPFEVRPTGWTCSASWEKHSSAGIQFVCLREHDTIAFRFY
jgi:hypothetical protein